MTNNPDFEETKTNFDEFFTPDDSTKKEESMPQ